MRRFIYSIAMSIFLLAACAPATPAPTATPKPTNTPLPTATATATPVIVVFTPEHFQVGEMGLLRNPATGKDMCVMNPEADWERAYEAYVLAFRQFDINYRKLLGGQATDAERYSEKEFLEKAKAGETLTFRIPTRDHPDYSEFLNKDKEHSFYRQLHDENPGTLVAADLVNAKLDNIKMQILDPEHFREYTGAGWYDKTQRALAQGLSTRDRGIGAVDIHVGADGRIVVATGSFDHGKIPVPGTSSLAIGYFDPELHEKYLTRFREDGLGINVCDAVSYFAMLPADTWMVNAGGFRTVNTSYIVGGTYKYVSTGWGIFSVEGESSNNPKGHWYYETPLFCR